MTSHVLQVTVLLNYVIFFHEKLCLFPGFVVSGIPFNNEHNYGNTVFLNSEMALKFIRKKCFDSVVTCSWRHIMFSSARL